MRDLDLPANPRDLIPDDEYQTMMDHLAYLARLRWRVSMIHECGHARCYPWPTCQSARSTA